MSWEDGKGRHVTDTDEGAWMIRCSCRPLFSRLPSLKRKRRRSAPVVAVGEKNGTMPGEIEFGICRLADRAKLATRRVLNKRGITSRPLECNLISNTFSPNLCQFFRLLLRLLFRLGKREKTGLQLQRIVQACSCNACGRTCNITPYSIFRRHLYFINVVIGGLDP